MFLVLRGTTFICTLISQLHESISFHFLLTRETCRVLWSLFRVSYQKDTTAREENCAFLRLSEPFEKQNMKILTCKVSARVQNANFRNFWFRDVHIKLFKSFLLKKNSQKYYCSAKLLDVEVYYTLIVLITRWQVLSFWSNLYVNTSRNKSQGIVVSFYHAIHAARLVQMPSEKKEEVVSVFVCNGKAEV